MADFTGLTAWAVQQDFFAKTMLITFVNALCNGIKPAPKRKPGSKKSTKKRKPVINRTLALAELKKIIRKTVYHLGRLREYLKEFFKRITKQAEYSRKGQVVRGNLKPIKRSVYYKPV